MALKMVMKPEVIVAPPVVEAVPYQKVLVEAPSVTEVEALTGEYIELYQKFVYFEMKPLIARMEEIRKSLVAVANDTMDAAKPAVFTSPQGEVEFSIRGTKAEIAEPLAVVEALLSKFGPEATASVVDIALTPLRKMLSEAELKKYVTEVPGGRTLRSVRPV